MARSRGKALFHDPQGGFPPLPRLKMVRNSLREVDHDAEHGPIDRRTDRHRGHCQSLGGDRPIVEPATSQSCLDERSESGWDALATPASVPTVWRAVRALGLTVKKNSPPVRTRSA